MDKMYEFSSFQKDAVISPDVHLLSHEMELSEILVDNNQLYSFEIQNKLERELLKTKCFTVSSSKACFSIFHAGVYIFTIATLPPEKLL